MFSDILLAVDFDRTLTAQDSTIPQRNLEAIQYFMGTLRPVLTVKAPPLSMKY